MIIAGRDQQQNEIVVRRYMKPGMSCFVVDLSGV